jgi:NAD+ synthase (glutamine-hydrolysing)
MTTQNVKIVLAQLNLTVGDIDGNVMRIIAAAKQARDQLQGHVVVFPELAITGYPPEDLLLRADLYEYVLHGLEQIKRDVRDIDIVVGYPDKNINGIFNAASLIRDGRIVATYHKQHLPNYSVFDEKRYFAMGTDACVVDIQGIRAGITICEDVWMPGPVEQSARAGAQLLININASPFHINKQQERMAVLKQRIDEAGIPVVYVNQVGGQDELVFDGASMVLDERSDIRMSAPSFEEGLYTMEVRLLDNKVVLENNIITRSLPEEASVYKALVLGVRDYIEKNNFNGVVIGVSGGIDSALTLTIAADAIGAERVEAVSMPSRYTADMSTEDAQSEAAALGVDYHVIPIEPAFKSFLQMLADEFRDLPVDVTEENIQARCRGIVLMAIANKKRRIVLTTGNKSEMAVGYATLYGDMAGGFAVLKDVPKTLVYRLAAYRNSLGAVIPQRVLDRPPSAELAPDQKDEDSLPPYEVLDPILEYYVEQDKGMEEIVKLGYDEDVVRRVIGMVERNEYKRRQAAPGVRITRRAFGRDRRYPITSGYTAEMMK